MHFITSRYSAQTQKVAMDICKSGFQIIVTDAEANHHPPGFHTINRILLDGSLQQEINVITLASKCREISRDRVHDFEWRQPVHRVILNQWNSEKLERKIDNFLVSILPANGVTPVGSRASVGLMFIKFGPIRNGTWRDVLCVHICSCMETMSGDFPRYQIHDFFHVT